MHTEWVLRHGKECLCLSSTRGLSAVAQLSPALLLQKMYLDRLTDQFKLMQ